MAPTPMPMPANGGALDALLHAWSAATAPMDARRESETSLSRQEDALLGPRASKRAARGEDAAACRPFDHAAFLARVSTFGIASWFAKPQAVSPFACARHGWRNVQPDLLYCPWCVLLVAVVMISVVHSRGYEWTGGAQLRAVPVLRDQLQDQRSGERGDGYVVLLLAVQMADRERCGPLQGVAKIADVFAAQLETGHTSLCPWRGNPSPVEFTTVSRQSPPPRCVDAVVTLLSMCWGNRFSYRSGPSSALGRASPRASKRISSGHGVTDCGRTSWRSVFK